MRKLYILAGLCFTCIQATGQSTIHVDSNQVYQEIVNPTYEIPDNSQYFTNITNKPGITTGAFGPAIYDLKTNPVYIPIKQGYCFFDNGKTSLTIYGCKGDYTKRPGQTSVFSFKNDTIGGKPVFIMQWKNMGFLNGHDTDFINFQIWLYEGIWGKVIQFKFGSSKVRPGLYENGANGPTIGLLHMSADFSTIYNEVWLKGNPLQPEITSESTIINLDRTPPNGTVYTFYNYWESISETRIANGLKVFPNPVTDVLKLKLSGDAGIHTIRVLTIAGREILAETNREEIHVSSLDPGLYIIEVISEEGAVSRVKFRKD